MANPAGMLNYTTKIPHSVTTGECLSMLARAGAAAVSIEFDSEAVPCGIGFRLNTPHGPRHFSLPVSIDGVHAILLKERKPGGRIASLHLSAAQRDQLASRDRAADIAWRVVKDWLEATLALIAHGMADLTEVMLPHLVVDEGRTLWQAYQAREQAALTAGGTDARPHQETP